jgi:predicted transcriptional regulator
MTLPIKKVSIGVMSLTDYKKRTIAIAKGEYRVQKDEPKIWFRSMKSLAHVLSEDNQRLLKIIIDQKPQSISELGPLTGRKPNNLLRTLRTMEQYGLVSLIKGKVGDRGKSPLIPKVLYDVANVQIHLH